jgi:hypothetical protein
MWRGLTDPAPEVCLLLPTVYSHGMTLLLKTNWSWIRISEVSGTGDMVQGVERLASTMS